MPVPIRAFLDTSVLYPRRTRHDLMSLADAFYPKAPEDEALLLFWSPWVIGELYRTLTAARLGDGTDVATQRKSANAMMLNISSRVRVVDPVPPYPRIPECLDAYDEPVWWGAVAARASYLVSDDGNHAPRPWSDGRRVWVAPSGEIEFVTVRVFIDTIRERLS